MSLFVLMLVVILLLAALATLLLPNMIAAVAAASVVSLGLAIIFALLKAPDVAMTEAAIGAGLSSLILALALKPLGYSQLRRSDPDKEARQKPQTATRRKQS